MSKFLNYFLKGIVFLAPLAFTVYICVRVFTTIDGWLGIPYPGAGFLATIAFITGFGFVAQNFLTRRALGLIENLLNRLPFVRLLYSSTKDLLNAFVGEQRRFDKPVLVSVFPGGVVRTIGFLTQESLAGLGLSEHVTVYMPQSYGFAGQLVIVPASAVSPINADSADVMAFIVSGGVTAAPGITSASLQRSSLTPGSSAPTDLMVAKAPP
ncbi:MAG: rane protein [Gemmatimonadetes bacterium]|nr:rane protein [Gemmatimonadota bacterium]